MMNSLFTLFTCAARRWLLATVALLLAACGPGVGGTGTGAEPGPAGFAAQASDLCAGPLASILACPTSGASAPALQPGTAAVDWLNDTARARIQGNHIELTLPCQPLSFSGDWGTVGGAAPRFYGVVSSPAASGAAQLDVLVAGEQLSLRLFDLQGALLLGPVLLQRHPAGAAPPAVPGC